MRLEIQNNFFLLVEARHNWNNFHSFVLCLSIVTAIAISLSGNKNNALAVFTNCKIRRVKTNYDCCLQSHERLEPAIMMWLNKKNLQRADNKCTKGWHVYKIEGSYATIGRGVARMVRFSIVPSSKFNLVSHYSNFID
jgi:hypothetical protein